MPDIATISAFLGSIKTASDLAKAIKLSDSSIEKAELKLKIAELMESLADVKMQAIEIQQIIIDKDEEIKKLKIQKQKQTELSYKNEPISEECKLILKKFTDTDSSYWPLNT